MRVMKAQILPMEAHWAGLPFHDNDCSARKSREIDQDGGWHKLGRKQLVFPWLVVNFKVWKYRSCSKCFLLSYVFTKTIRNGELFYLYMYSMLRFNFLNCFWNTFFILLLQANTNITVFWKKKRSSFCGLNLPMEVVALSSSGQCDFPSR